MTCICIMYYLVSPERTIWMFACIIIYMYMYIHVYLGKIFSEHSDDVGGFCSEHVHGDVGLTTAAVDKVLHQLE